MSDFAFDQSVPVALSPAGRRRQGEILGSMQAAGRTRRVRRRGMQVASLALPLACVAAAAVLLKAAPAHTPAPIARDRSNAPELPPPAPVGFPEAPPPPALAGAESASEAPAFGAIRYSIAETDPEILARVTIAPIPLQVTYLDDAELSRELALAGLDPGIVRTPTQVLVLAFNDLQQVQQSR